MEITLHTIKIRDLTNGFVDNAEDGVKGYGGKLDIRPPYQREFCYSDDKQQAVMDTVCQGFPLNTMYWVEREDGTYEVLDGQQRTLSICNYVAGEYVHNCMYFHNLQSDEKEKNLNYELQIYFCKGTDSEKLEWFKTINIAGERLKDQEIRNAVYAGSWTAAAKKIFSKSNCAAKLVSSNYVYGTPIRQDLLETAFGWYVGKDDKLICNYMAKHQHDNDANELWIYFQGVIAWVKALFVTYRKEMKGIDWRMLYNSYYGIKNRPDLTTQLRPDLTTQLLEEKISKLMADEDVTNKKGIYYYVFDGKKSHLNIRAFLDRDKRTVYEAQKGICPMCGKHFEYTQMEGDLKVPWSKGGKTVLENLQMLCIECNLTKTDR